MKIINKIKKKLNNRGSSIVMVIVSLAFVGIVVAALLSAAGYTYKLKLQELNAKDNYYYVDQAMEEIYAGVGSQTINELKEAYTYTLENMVRFDTDLGTYYTISDEEANAMFKQQFMNNIKNSTYFNQGTENLAKCLSNYISNETVQLDSKKLSLVKKSDEIIIQNVTLTRTQEYSKSTANGTYTQTVSADITISEPDFDVKFNNLASDYSVIFDYAMVADMGVEINEGESVPLTIIGNVYAASDYYNKSYNSSLNETSVPSGTLTATDLANTDGTISGTYTVGTASQEISYDFSNITNKKLTLGVGDSQTESGYVNDYARDEYNQLYGFDGLNENSRYSGFYINNTNVSILGESVIVPGTIAVMNSSNLTIYGKTGASELPQVWADDIVLGGTSKAVTPSGTTTTDDDTVKVTYDGSSATFRANLFVKDDTEINAEGSDFTLTGSYYGYGDSTSRDTRVYFDTVDKNYFMLPEYDEDGNIKRDSEGNILYAFNRGHYNSSAIIVNGENAKLDFSNASQLYLAGRAYIELSKYVTEKVDDENNTRTDTYQYIPSYNKTNADGSTEEVFVEDYKTGESLSYKSNQLAYIVSSLGIPKTVEAVNNDKFTGIKLPDTMSGVGEFGELFPTSIFDGYIPVKTQTIKYTDTATNTAKSRDYSLIDFDTAYDIISKVAQDTTSTGYADATAIVDDYASVDRYQTAYAIFYATESAKGETSLFYPDLADITSYDGFNNGTELLDTSDTSKTLVYSSGALSVRNNNKFTLVTAYGDDLDGTDVVSKLLQASSTLQNYSSDAMAGSTQTSALDLSNDLEMEYNYMKWNLAHYDSNDIEKQYVKDVVAVFGEDSLTPINKYMNFKNLSVKPNDSFVVNGYELNGSNGSIVYRLWAGEKDVVITGAENITGIVITSGDVSFGSDVKTFEGVIIAGGKIYVNGNVSSINAAPATCREILRQCMVVNDNSCKYVLNLFKEYAPETMEWEGAGTSNPDDPDSEEDEDYSISVDSISYTDVVSVTNWMKNVGGAYETDGE